MLDLEGAGAKVAEAVAAGIAHAVSTDGCDAVVLGCAGMADLAEDMTERFGILAIGGVAAAVTFCEALHRAGIDNSPQRPLAAASQ